MICFDCRDVLNFFDRSRAVSNSEDLCRAQKPWLCGGAYSGSCVYHVAGTSVSWRVRSLGKLSIVENWTNETSNICIYLYRCVYGVVFNSVKLRFLGMKHVGPERWLTPMNSKPKLDRSKDDLVEVPWRFEAAPSEWEVRPARAAGSWGSGLVLISTDYWILWYVMYNIFMI